MYFFTEHKEKNNEVDEANRSIAKLKQEVDQLNAELGKSQCDLHQAEVKLTTEKVRQCFTQIWG